MASKRTELKKSIDQDMATRDLPLKSHQAATEGVNNDPMTIFSIRLPQSQKAALKAHFKQELGLDLSSGIRMILTQYMREKRI